MDVRTIIMACAVGSAMNAGAQTEAAGNAPRVQQFLSAQESDPVCFGWMQGSPPPADRVLHVRDGSFFRFPALRWSVVHMREFLPTVRVAPRCRKCSSPHASPTHIGWVTCGFHTLYPQSPDFIRPLQYGSKLSSHDQMLHLQFRCVPLAAASVPAPMYLRHISAGSLVASMLDFRSCA